MKTITWQLTIGYPTADRDGEFEVPDDTCDEEIDELVREEAMNFVEWSWTKSDAEASELPSQNGGAAT